MDSELVPSQELVVARFLPAIVRIQDYCEEGGPAKAWLTRNQTDEKERTPWVLRVFPQYREEINKEFHQSLVIMDRDRDFGCINGIPLIQIRNKVSTVGGEERPPTLYRAIHGLHPHGGIKSRLGHGSDPVWFHHHLRRHLRWQAREPSPFLSATTNYGKARSVAHKYLRQGFPDVRIITFKTSGPGWDHERQRLWNPRDLVKALSPSDNRWYLDDEFLIEYSIPELSIVRTESFAAYLSHRVRRPKRLQKIYEEKSGNNEKTVLEPAKKTCALNSTERSVAGAEGKPLSFEEWLKMIFAWDTKPKRKASRKLTSSEKKHRKEVKRYKRFRIGPKMKPNAAS
ncbi:hypothetical protein C8035_v002780 [Colletotrichum spinosum]|uniref:DUF7587 domain-containing protein n=1 Tax=Colletotrichum spinosum TaxID=1347390 RepID=A0A4R8Q0V1_9PEZI|nr:hypothetical protein C8035_v002780 [Colletotrichum spinosum]